MTPTVLAAPAIAEPGHALEGQRPSAVFLTHSSFTSPFRVGSHQLSQVLDAAGWRVLHVPTPVTPVHGALAALRPAYRERWAQVLQPRQIAASVHELIPLSLVPWQVARLLPAVAPSVYAFGQQRFGRLVRALDFARPELLFLDEPRLLGMCRHFAPRQMFYRATDLYHQMSGDSTVIPAERAALARADGFIATSQPVYQHLRTLAPDKAGLVVENGVDFEHFHTPQDEPPELAAISHPRAIYVGALDGRFDFRTVAALAEACPEWSFILIGPPAGGFALPGNLPNVYSLGARPYEKIPAYLQHADAALLPLSDHPANSGRSPMKIYEYGAAGLPVLATATAELTRRSLPFVHLCASLADFAQTLEASLAHRDFFRGLAIAAARRMSWAGRLEAIRQFADGLLPAAGAGGKERAK